MSGSWEGEEQDADEVKFKETDEVTACRRNDSVAHRLRAARCQTACRRDEQDTSVMKKRKRSLTRDIYG